MGLSTHILDTALGRPAAGVSLTLAVLDGTEWRHAGSGMTDADGRCRTLLGEKPLETKTYRIRFATSGYFAAQKLTGLYPYIDIVFRVADATQHHHIPLLLTSNGYTTYRGS